MAAAVHDRDERKLAKSLLCCVESDNPKLATAVLAAGASVDGSPTQKYRPLIYASERGKARMVKLLLNKGADVDAGLMEDTHGGDGVRVSIKGWRALHAAASYREISVARLLIKAGAAIDAADAGGTTPLMTACIGRYVSTTSRLAIVQELLTAGADATLTNKTGETALHGAATRGDDMDVIDLLVATAPTTLNHADNQGATPLCIAAYHGSENAVRRLLAAGARQSTTHGHIKCPFLLAVQQGHEGVARILDSAPRDALSRPSLAIYAGMQAAVLHDRVRILHMLCASRADGKETASLAFRAICRVYTELLRLAVERSSCPATISVLLAAGADAEGLDLTGRPGGTVIGRRGKVTEATKAACRRMLHRAPALSAVSWAWPSRSAPAVAHPVREAQGSCPALSVRVFRPSARRVVVSFISR